MGEALLVGLITLATVVLLATEKLAPDIVAVLVLVALAVLGLVTPQEAISGFSNAATVTVAAMFVLSAGLRHTGALDVATRSLVRLAVNGPLMLLLVVLGAGAVSAFINNTAVVAMLLPVVLAAANRRRISPSKVLIPLSYASQFGGVCTLIGTSTNLLVSSLAVGAGMQAFGLFEFAPLGLVMLGAGALYLLLVGWWLLPARRESAELTETYRLSDYITELEIAPGSPLIGRTLREADVEHRHAVSVLELIRGPKHMLGSHETVLAPGDVLLVRGGVEALLAITRTLKLVSRPRERFADAALQGEELVLVEALLAPRSRLAGRTLAELEFDWRYNAVVLALARRGEVLREKLGAVVLQSGDALLLLARREELPFLRGNDNFVVLNAADEPGAQRRRAPIALAVMAAVLVATGLELLPVEIAALLGAAALLVFRCLTPEQAYGAVDWRILVLLAGVLPLGIAMERSGAADALVRAGLALVGREDPQLALGLIYLLTLVLTEVMSNAAAAVLMVPIGIALADSLGVDARPFLVAVAFAASVNFATPFGYQTNLMVYNAGGYRFRDFLRVGLPLDLLFLALSVWLIPRFWPF